MSISVYDAAIQKMRNSGISNCSGFVFHELGIEEKDHYVGASETIMYLSKMETSYKPVHRSVLVVKHTGRLHVGLVERQEERFIVKFRNGRGIDKPIETMPLEEFLSKITPICHKEYKIPA